MNYQSINYQADISLWDKTSKTVIENVGALVVTIKSKLILPGFEVRSSYPLNHHLIIQLRHLIWKTVKRRPLPPRY